MRPRLIASENLDSSGYIGVMYSRFNEAEADRLGKLAEQSHYLRVSMSFNEAEADRLGKRIATKAPQPRPTMLQ